MTTRFETLFAVSVAHAYYTGTCEDVAFVVPADTAALLRNGKLLTRELDGRLHVLFEADESKAALRPISGKTLRVGLRLRNSCFSNITHVDESFCSSTLLYRNSATSGALDAPEKVQLVGPVFSHELSRSARPVTVTLKDGTGATRQTETITTGANRSAVSYDLSGQASAAYGLEEDYPTSTVQNAYYLDAELMRAAVFGVIEVKIDADFYTAPPHFEIPFDAREEPLKYYVVARNFRDDDFDKLSVSDTGFGEDGRPKITFVKVPSSSFTEAEISPDLLGDSATRVILFKSQAAVARTEKARKKIQLKKNDDVLIAHLPQPGPDKATADLIIPVSKP